MLCNSVAGLSVVLTKHLVGIQELRSFAYSVMISFTFSKYGIYNVVIVIISPQMQAGAVQTVQYSHWRPDLCPVLGFSIEEGPPTADKEAL